MHTLEEIYQKLNSITGTNTSYYPITVQATGQTITYAPGDDGYLEKGAKADPRFTDNGNGTVTDNLTGLIWLKNANYLGSTRTWSDALVAANNLANGIGGLTDGSVQGDWRLPNVRELQSLIDYGRYNPALPAGHPFTNVQSVFYWSSTTYADTTNIPNNAWYVYFYNGVLYVNGKTNSYSVWCVRGGS
ncbi:MAG: DUF1566 domain-containing protein [Candidatus Brocadia sp.]|nr:MAG: DUF1566 domain-containing protein [Candidatus Brocadia sp.]